MAIKKSDLYSSIWKSCDELRGGMDASQYKDYILVLLFVKYVSDKYAGEPYAPIVVPDGGSFADMREAKGKTDIGERLNVIIRKLADENGLRGVIDTADFDDKAKLGDGKEMQDRLTKLIAIFENPALDFSQNRAEGDDLLGDAYEYLMRNFATQSGKSKGQFYTPAEVSRIIAQIIGLHTVQSREETIYDPTCGSGSLLLKAADEVPTEVGGITLYGQEKDNSTRALAKMNMILHGQASAKIEQGNTLSTPLFRDENGYLQTFDFAIANPPFSDKAWSNGITPEEDEFNRFIDGAPPPKNGDFAYLQHLLRSLKSSGKGAIILPHGVLFRGNMEAEIRKRIVKRGYIKGIIGLPANLFFGTGIPACIIVIDKENASPQRGIFMIDASKGYIKDGNKNRLRHQDIHKIVDVFNNQIELPRYSRLVTTDEIEANDYNLNILRYIDISEPEDIQDIEAHLLGGIPNRDLDALDPYWQVIPSLPDILFRTYGRDGYSDLNVEPAAIKTTIFQHPEFVQYAEQVKAVYASWRDGTLPTLKAIAPGDSPKALIQRIGESLLQCFADVPLIDKYDVYQHLMTYWADTMQDDVYILATDGWLKGNKIPEMQNWLTVIGQLTAEREQLSKRLIQLDAKHGDKGGVLAPGKHGGRFTRKRLEAALDKAKKARSWDEHLQILTECLEVVKRHDELEEQIAKGRQKLEALFGETLFPIDHVIRRFFGAELQSISELEAKAEGVTQELAELEEEHGAEDGLLYEAKGDSGKFGKGSVETRLNQLTDDPDEAEEARILKRWLQLNEQKNDFDTQAKTVGNDLHEKLLHRYPALTENDIKALVIEDKWLAAIEADVKSELARISQALAGRINQLAERYAAPLPELERRAAELGERVRGHLNKMGYV